jgi:hypothetical protein
MDAKQALVRLVQEHTKGFIKAVRCFPKDKLTWQARPKNRTPLDIIQEVATVAWGIPEVVRTRKMTWSEEDFAKMLAARAKLTDVEAIIAKIEAATAMIVAMINATDPADYDNTVEMPWPGDFRIVDMLTYHMWNINYHEGQLIYILMALELPTPYDHA